jgi:hypothetical protein
MSHFHFAAVLTAIVVTPAHPAPTDPVTVSFKAPVAVGDGSRWYDVDVTAPVRDRRCEHYEAAEATSARKGQRVTLTLRPVDKRRWCAGDYVGTLYLNHRVRCDDRIDDGTCYLNRHLGAVRFRVEP